MNVRILINDFIGGVLDRGIPLYVRNLTGGLREEGFQVSVVRAPRFLRMLPRGLFYMLAVAVEQIVLPPLGFFLRADLTLYPYNSIAIADLLTRRGRIVVHDLEPLNRPASFSKTYYRACYRALKRLNAPIFTISELTRQRMAESGLFGQGEITILPNTFYSFERLLRAGRRRAGEKSILFCTGSTANKDLDAVAADYLPRALEAGLHISVFGLHKAGDAQKLAALERYVASGRLRICGRLTDRQAAREYLSHDIVWVHALREGFGRCVVEGRLAGCRVIATAIPEFAALRDGAVDLYRNADEFMAALERVAQLPLPQQSYEAYPYRTMLRTAISRGFAAVTAVRSGARSQPAR
jgi:glycosyltransferase involved in cell wall biosynthesis